MIFTMPHRAFCLHTDASDGGLRALLTQEMPTEEQPVFFLSPKLSKPKQNYAVIEEEALAIWWAMEHLNTIYGVASSQS